MMDRPTEHKSTQNRSTQKKSTLNKPVCLITGASRGLGLCLAEQLRSKGFYVVALARDAERLGQAQTAAAIDDWLQCDLSDPAQVDTCIQQFENRYDRLDLLVHNAGIQYSYSVLQDCHYGQRLSHEHQVNFLAPVRLTHAFLPMLLNSRGHILAISSLLQFGPKLSAPGYCSSKAALSNWLDNLRGQLCDANVRVSEVIPGLMATDMQDGKGLAPEKIAVEIVNKLVKDRIVTAGARIAWLLYSCNPRLLRRKLLK